MFGRICPYCKERVKRKALICRYCHKELEPVEGNLDGSLGLFAGFIGLAAGAAAVFLYGYIRERRKWHQDDLTAYCLGESSDHD